MAYLRKPGDRKRGNPLSQNKSLPTPMRMPAAPMTPLLPCGEDSTSIQRHCQLLKNEMKKLTPNKAIITKLMEKTFHKRRQEIIQGMAVEDIMKSYPAFKYPEEVSLFFTFQIVRKQYLMNKFEKNWGQSRHIFYIAYSSDSPIIIAFKLYKNLPFGLKACKNDRP